MIKSGLLSKDVSNKSFSKLIVEYVDKNISYDYYDAENENVAENTIKSKNFDYLNITFPYKKTVIKLLDSCSEYVSKTGVCNLIVNENNNMVGYNTDVDGFLYLINKESVKIFEKNILIIGNGATSATIRYCLELLKAKLIFVGCRNKKNEGDLYFNELPKDKIDVIVNTTPVGMNENDEQIINLKEFSNLYSYVDLIYNPKNTKTMIQAKTLGIKCVGGLSMLIKQAQLSYYIYTQKQNEKWSEVRSYINTTKRNLIFIGMPTSGKTKIAKLIFNEGIYKKFFDTDEEIEKQEKLKISQIFEKYGESYFREKEEELSKKLSKEVGCIISSGGGFILNESNYKSLATNSYFIYLKKENFDTFVDDGTRPLVKTKEDLYSLYAKRKMMYEKRSDLTLKDDASEEELIKEIKNAINNY